ncbi:MAG: hypothetical protein KKA84_11090 [Bacteroidetes bacterium]|nr:hypothetical protein [Bacteroidota bacterium]
MLVKTGFSYYTTPIENRFFHDMHVSLKPSGFLGHGYGIVGTLFIILGVSLYMLRKRYRIFSRVGLLKYWLEFHIFLCTIGPILILFHTAFKFGGIVSISFWSMVAVFISGVLGRFIYNQIPRSIQGNEFTFEELQTQNLALSNQLKNKYQINDSLLNKIEKLVEVDSYKSISIPVLLPIIVKDFFLKRRLLKELKKNLTRHNIGNKEQKNILRLSSNKIVLVRRIGLLSVMQKVFNYWHIVHLPFALVMLIIMVIHVAITIVFGYRWIF